MILVTRYIVPVKTCTSYKNNNSIILIFIFLIRIDLTYYIFDQKKPGNALITQFSDIIEQIKTQPSAQGSTQNHNVGYTYFYSPNLKKKDDITINSYYKIQLHDIGNL